jgi:lysophospholipase L1-like esterase
MRRKSVLAIGIGAALAVVAGAAVVVALTGPGTEDVPDALIEEPPPSYVALGDSYSSGTGVGDYIDDRCLRSELAYPALLAAELGGPFEFAACSGATTADVLSDQIGALEPDTDLVTVGIGGNDIGWNLALAACMLPEGVDCTPAITTAERAAQDDLPALLDGVYSAIAERSPQADVYVLGYPRLFTEEEPCATLPNVTLDEQVRMNEAADLLADVIEGKAAEFGFTYVDVRDVYEGHAVCSEESWINGLVNPPVDSFHPNAAGHQGYFQVLADVL